MVSNEQKATNDVVNESFGRCLMKPDFFDRFYEVFLSSNPVIKGYFKNTDFTKQKQLLRQGLSAALLYARGSGSAKFLVDNITKTHSRHQLNITPGLYPYWIDSLIKVVEDCDPKFTPELEKEWRQTIAIVVDQIKGGY
ncbi:MAG: globin [Deltaproteobacteria bacterium]|nr:globin [Deltaproteobacteria bacterium]